MEVGMETANTEGKGLHLAPGDQKRHAPGDRINEQPGIEQISAEKDKAALEVHDADEVDLQTKKRQRLVRQR